MSFVVTTLGAACAVTDRQIQVASATNFAAGQLIRIDDEFMKVTQAYASGVLIPVLRGREGSVTAAHVKTANVITDALTDNLWGAPGSGTLVTSQIYGRQCQIVSVSATSTLTLPVAGVDMRVILNGTSVITLTIPVPTADMDGTHLVILSNGAAAHVLTFTSTLNNAGSGYTSFTNNASGTLAVQVWACNGFWTVPSAPAWTGTVTKVVGGIA